MARRRQQVMKSKAIKISNLIQDRKKQDWQKITSQHFKLYTEWFNWQIQINLHKLPQVHPFNVPVVRW